MTRATCGRGLAAVFAIMLGLAAGPRDAGAADLIRVGEGPFITGGAFYIARDKGYFAKLGLQIETKSFIDGALAVPSMVAGELDITFMTPNASLFNSIAKGAPLVVILDRGNNRKGFAYTLVNVTQALYDQGVHAMGDFAKLKGKKMGVGALGSINQYNLAQALLKVGLDPAKDVQWVVNVSQPDLMKMLGQGQVDATDLAWQFGVLAQNNKWGPIVATGDQMVPDATIGMYAARKEFLEKNHDAAVRFAMAYLHAIPEFNAAAKAPDQHPERLYGVLARLAGALLTFSTTETLKAIPPYDHHAPEPVFAELESLIRTLLDTVIPSRVVPIALERVRPTAWIGKINDERLVDGADYYLSVQAGVPAHVLLEQLPRLCKAGAPDEVEQIVNSALPGIPLRTLARLPAAIPIRIENQYFALDSAHPAFTRMIAARACQFYVPASIPDVSLELYAVLPT